MASKGRPSDLDTYADDLAALLEGLELDDVILVGHSTGGGEVVRYIGRQGNGRVSKLVLISAIVPLMLKTDANPERTPIEAFDELRKAVLRNRAQFFKDVSMPFYGYNRDPSKVSEGVREAFWLQGMMAGLPVCCYSIKAFSETDLTEDLKAIDVPTLLIHGDDDQIVSIKASALLASRIINNAPLIVYEGGSQGICTTEKNGVCADLLVFLRGL
jgi:non-heme chloroperoxidase